MQGFLRSKPGYEDVYTQEHQKNVRKWLSEGKLKAKIHITDGIDNADKGFVDMLKGDNFGKAVLKIKE